MRDLAVISALVVFGLALIAVSPALGENEIALDLPQYKIDSEHVVAVKLNEESISDDQNIPETKINMSPEYFPYGRLKISVLTFGKGPNHSITRDTMRIVS